MKHTKGLLRTTRRNVHSERPFPLQSIMEEEEEEDPMMHLLSGEEREKKEETGMTE